MKNKNILVTGADGFIGSHLTELLVINGANVRALSQYNSFNYWGWLEDTECINEIEVVAGDVRDPYYCKKITKGIDIIFHLAALIAIPYSYVAPDSYVDTNIKGTMNLCQAAIENDVQRFVHTSTSEVYGTAKYVPIDELHPLQPQSPYSASKIGADAMAMSFYLTFNLPLVIARPFNTYGPRQSARAIIPTIITQICSSQEKLALGDLSPTRDLNFVEDTCRALTLLANCEHTIGQTVNIGSNKESSMKTVVHMIKDIMQSDIEIVTESKRIRPKKSEVFRLRCDNTKIRELTGFVPKYSLREGLEKTIEWFKNSENLNKYKSSIYNV
ncbi:NAD-dependent 4,6-dehydratase LegB [uncultured Desulfosarcina sp.]|uniref:NAD-dependent 4,6-dehydratase LegB n=1 Tax=uncultured Desulfosarcina sp. TaxID=218289 RepID=UPI0029C7DB58|nr:NAD-dependent 4,6-dehydratase LegB [uncultured Desulfosarcina sp.]